MGLEVYGPLGLFCTALIAAVVALWRKLGRSEARNEALQDRLETMAKKAQEHAGEVTARSLEVAQKWHHFGEQMHSFAERIVRRREGG